MSRDYYQVSEYLCYQIFDVNMPDQVFDVTIPETSNSDSIKDRLEKLIGLELFDPEDETASEPLEETETLMYRFSLPFEATIAEQQKFRQDIEWIKDKNRSWEVLPDMPKFSEESEAWIMIYKDENYLNARISYLINSSILTSLTQSYDKREYS